MVESIDSSALVATEDTIEALLEYLVSPLLPIRDSKDEMPTESQQGMVAKQIHAVVILYNYYHRKYFPKLEALGLESFCKICCIAKPSLLAYMRYMLRCKEDPENINQFSITEKMVMDSCNICIGLDSSKEIPSIEGWPVLKIAVFLVDSMKEKCVLQFCSITQGTWSLVEKVLYSHDEKVNPNGSSQNISYKSEEVLEKLAFSAVEQEIGISHSNLSILERHLTYSLTCEKSATRLYIMTYGATVSEELTEVAIKDVLRSLKGPIVKRALSSVVEVTSVVEHYNLLPYIEIISNWLSRENTDGAFLHLLGQQVINDAKCTSLTNVLSLMEDHEVNNNSVLHDSEQDMHDSDMSRSTTETIDTKRKDQSIVNGPLHLLGQQVINDAKCTSLTNVLSLMEDHEVNNNSVNDSEQDMHDSDMSRSKTETIDTKRKDQSIVIGPSGTAKLSKCTTGATKLDQDRLTITKDQALDGTRLQKSSDDKTLNSKKNKSRDAITYTRKVGRPSKSATSSEVADLNRCSVSDKIPVRVDNVTNMNEQNLSLGSNKMVKTENPTIEKSINDLPANNESSCEVTRLQNSADISQAKDKLDTMKDYATNDQMLKSVRAKDIVVCKKNNKKNNRQNKDVGGTCRSLATRADNSCKDDSSSLQFHQKLPVKEGISGKSITPDSCVDRVKVLVETGPTLQVDGSDKTGIVDSVEKACVIKCTDKGKTNASDKEQGFASGDLPLVPFQFSSNDHSTFYHMMASKKDDLLQAAYRVFQKKRNGLLQQRRLLEDEIARCEMNIQIILSEEEASAASKVESIIEALNSVGSSQMQMGMILSSEEESPSQAIKRRKLSESVLSSRNFCQELDDICYMNSWMLPRYRVLPPSANSQAIGSYQSTVTVKGTDFDCTCEGILKSGPREARESAASHMLSKLRSLADQGL